jgi:hypothetical protein
MAEYDAFTIPCPFLYRRPSDTRLYISNWRSPPGTDWRLIFGLVLGEIIIVFCGDASVKDQATPLEFVI